MRFLDTATLKFKDFSRLPDEYAVLSHTWEDEEVLYQDILNDSAHLKKGWSKVTKCCQRAATDSFKLVWIDTCCIDKTNNVELSEAINSMFRLYEGSTVCYAYLADVDRKDKSKPVGQSRWFSRGWTLQELLAPRYVAFVDCQWQDLGSKSFLHSEIESATSISKEDQISFRECNIAKKMSWASKRKTTIVEDEAYCLLGLFGINLPLIYGEGRKAFKRLQEELIKQYDDESLFAWFKVRSKGFFAPALAQSPRNFPLDSLTASYARESDPDRPEYFLSNKGLVITPILYQLPFEDPSGLTHFLLPLNCANNLCKPDECLAILLTNESGNMFYRTTRQLCIFDFKAFSAKSADDSDSWSVPHLESDGRRKIFVSTFDPVSEKLKLMEFIRFSSQKDARLIATAAPPEYRDTTTPVQPIDANRRALRCTVGRPIDENRPNQWRFFKDEEQYFSTSNSSSLIAIFETTGMLTPFMFCVKISNPNWYYSRDGLGFGIRSWPVKTVYDPNGVFDAQLMFNTSDATLAGKKNTDHATVKTEGVVLKVWMQPLGQGDSAWRRRVVDVRIAVS